MPLRARLGSLFMFALVSCILAQSTGCSSVPSGNGGYLMDRMFVGYRDRVWAARAYNEQFGGHPGLFTDHHRRGFIDGYCSVCRGGNGYVPALPPKDYWSSQYQSEQGSECVNEWFEGYPEGAAVAGRDNAGRYNNVYISRMVDVAITQEKNGVSLPSDIRVVRNEEPTDPVFDAGKSRSAQRTGNGPLPLPASDWSMANPNTRSSSSADSVPPRPPVR